MEQTDYWPGLTVFYKNKKERFTGEQQHRKIRGSDKSIVLPVNFYRTTKI